MTEQSMRDDFEAHWHDTYHAGVIQCSADGGYWEEDVQKAWSAWQAATRQALERAAKVCEERAETHHDLHKMNDRSIYWFDKAEEDRDCADAIRALEG